MNNISIIIPSHNNLRHLKNAYTSIKKHAPESEICIADDASTDGTYEWLKTLKDENLKFIRVEKLQGHTILYDTLIDEVAKNEIVTIIHADMIMSPNYLENMVKHLKPGIVVSGTRVEPPLHPPGKEKIIMDFGMDFDTLNIEAFESYVEELQVKHLNQKTSGIFAPWMVYKSDFQEINGHDPVFAPYPYEDSDIFNRMLLAGYELIQSRDAFVYHLTCRGHKWQDGVNKVHDKFPIYEERARKNYLRKWGCWVENDEYQHPIVPPRYKKTLVIEPEMTSPEHLINLITALEPWFDSVDHKFVYNDVVKKWIATENENTDIDISSKFNQERYDIVVTIKPGNSTEQDFAYIQQLPKIIEDSGEPDTEFMLGNLGIRIGEMKDLNDKLIKLKKYDFNYLS